MTRTSARREPSLAQARVQRDAHGWRAYAGPRIKGERHVLVKGGPGFPEPLTSVPSPPERLYVIGRVEALREGLAIIGARRATPYGVACARRFATLAAKRGVTVIGGGAYGCDSVAHKAALDAGGCTVVFLGGGCDQPYPVANVGLFQRVVDSGGAVVSERVWDFPPLPYTFRARNRLIAGLSAATLIVEAGLPSGTFSTADDALDADKEVWVVPGAITSKTSAGANRLLYQGAFPIVDDDSFDDAVSRTFGMLRQESCAGREERRAADEDALLAALRASPMRLEDIVAARLDTKGYPGPYREWACLRLAELERAGEVARYPDGRYGPARL